MTFVLSARLGCEESEYVFITHEVAVDSRFEAAAVRLVNLINRGALRGASGIAYNAGVEAVLRVGPFGDIRGFSKLVHVRFLDPVRRGSTMTVALRWEAAGGTGELFPVLDADLVLARDGDDRSRLAAIGTYRPPFGRAGAALDRAIMHRLAMATIRSLLANVADAIAHPAPGPQPATTVHSQWPPVGFQNLATAADLQGRG